jgi:hypothetical protein
MKIGDGSELRKAMTRLKKRMLLLYLAKRSKKLLLEVVSTLYGL